MLPAHLLWPPADPLRLPIPLLRRLPKLLAYLLCPQLNLHSTMLFLPILPQQPLPMPPQHLRLLLAFLPSPRPVLLRLLRLLQIQLVSTLILIHQVPLLPLSLLLPQPDLLPLILLPISQPLLLQLLALPPRHLR